MSHLEDTFPDDTRLSGTLSLKGDASRATYKYMAARDIVQGAALREIYIAGLRSLGLVHPTYTSTDMRKGL